MGMRIARVIPVLFGIALLPDASTAVDLNGKWRFEISTAVEVVTVTQTGSSLTIPLVYPLTGTIDPTGADGFTTYSVSYVDASVGIEIFGRINPSGNLLDGRLGSLFMGMYDVAGLVATRCTCDDGNTADGDGCDATCQVEPCWTCAGDPSVCTPTAAGGACDDRRDCTTGETCTAGVCGGGAPVSPCVDMTGIWNRHLEIPALGVVDDSVSTATQRGGDVRMGAHVGAIDTVTGAFDLRAPDPDFFCSPFSPLIGTVSASGLTYEASGFVEEPQEFSPDHCDRFDVTETGTRCGSATIDPGEECDDGNLVEGDGCSADCHVEQCWTCSGAETSSCAPAGGGSCDDGSACTTDDTCAGDGTCTGIAVVCEPCLRCDEALGCIAQPRSPCKVSAAPKKSLLRIKNVADDTRDTFDWKWNDGEATTLDEIGDPRGGDDYAICVYDESGPAELLFRATAPGSELCGAESCWKSTRFGFRYKNQAAAPEGIVVARLKSGTPAKARAKGKGAHLSDHAAGLPSPPLPEQLRVQLQGENGLCLETRHDASTVLKNNARRGVFKARGAP